MARHPSDRRNEVLKPSGGAGADVEVALTPAEAAALHHVAKAGLDVLTALGQVTRTGVIDEALRPLAAAKRALSLSGVEATALAMFAERGLTILGALQLADDVAAATESGLAKLRAAQRAS
jgi:hypothetical protein